MIKEIAIKLRLWEENVPDFLLKEMEKERIFLDEALKHYCRPCKRWFGDVRGKLMHDRHGKHYA